MSEIETVRRELAEARRQQMAMAEALEAVALSTYDRDEMLRRLLRTAAGLCDANIAGISLVEGDDLVGAITLSGDPADEAFMRGFRLSMSDTDSLNVRSLLSGEPLQNPDAFGSMPGNTKGRDYFKFAAILSVPMVTDERRVGVFNLCRSKPGPFTDAQVAVVRSFAAQAVIAIVNAQRMEELERQRAEMAADYDREAVSAEVMRAINRSRVDLSAVLDQLTRSAVRLSGADMGGLFVRQGDFMIPHVGEHVDAETAAFLRANPIPFKAATILAQAARTGESLEVVEFEEPIEKTYRDRFDYRALLHAPMMADGECVGVLSIARRNSGPFTQRQKNVIRSFAEQAAIAVRNLRLFKDLEARTAELHRSLQELRAAQDRLIQSEKLASLGQLTAGVAHEIKNPLNFVNNFSKLAVELMEELGDALRSAELPQHLRDEVEDLSQSLTDSMAKIHHHGQRADSIVKNMLLHARQDGGERRPVDLNALIEESLSLAYHGARAERQDFNIELRRDLDPTIGQVTLYPQGFTRVLLNLFSNGFYAASARAGEPGFKPSLQLSTRGLENQIEIRVRDNGMGVPEAIREKLFTPFFTTKPAGEGTGLGLSLSYEIIVQQHGGSLSFETETGAFTEFLITLPRERIEVGRP